MTSNSYILWYLGTVLDVICVSRNCDVKQINYMFAQYVKSTMQPLNISDVTKDQRFPWTVCMPLYWLFLGSFPKITYFLPCFWTEWLPRSHEQPDQKFALRPYQE